MAWQFVKTIDFRKVNLRFCVSMDRNLLSSLVDSETRCLYNLLRAYMQENTMHPYRVTANNHQTGTMFILMTQFKENM
jgi:hypothetical protein